MSVWCQCDDVSMMMTVWWRQCDDVSVMCEQQWIIKKRRSRWRLEVLFQRWTLKLSDDSHFIQTAVTNCFTQSDQRSHTWCSTQRLHKHYSTSESSATSGSFTGPVHRCFITGSVQRTQRSDQWWRIKPAVAPSGRSYNGSLDRFWLLSWSESGPDYRVDPVAPTELNPVWTSAGLSETVSWDVEWKVTRLSLRAGVDPVGATRN